MIKRPGMRRTLLVLGVAVLVSMLLTPHKQSWRWLGEKFYVRLHLTDEQRCTQGFTPRWDNYARRFERVCMGGYRNDYVPDWCRAIRWFPIFWLEDRNPILWANFAGQTAFAAVLAGLIVNLHKPSKER